jgi:TPR repeat protein
MGKCPFCNSDRDNITIEQQIEEIRRRVAANDPTSIYLLAHFYYMGIGGFPQDHAKAIELYSRSANFGCSAAHNQLGGIYYEGGYLKKAKFHYESAAMAGCEVARCDLGGVELQLGNMERAVKHWMIAASAGSFRSMHNLLVALKDRKVSRESIDSTLTAYNDSCVEMRSEARDAYISATTE